MPIPSANATRSESPTVSVLLAVHNGRRFVREAVDGVLAQTFRDFEFVIVDDASTDETPRILDSYDDPRIVRLRNPTNLGLTKSLNRGLAVARGRYVARIDADDTCRPERLARQVTHLEAHPEIAVLGTWTEEIDEHGQVVGESVVDPRPDFLAWQMTWQNPVFHSTAAFRREEIQRLGGYAEDVPYAQDHDLWTRVVMGGRPVAVLPEKLVGYRRSPSQITTQRFAEQERCGLGVRQRYVNWLLKRPVAASDVLAMRRLSERDDCWRVPDRERGLRLLRDVRRASSRRAQSGVRRAIRREVATTLLYHASRALYHGGDPRLSLLFLRTAFGTSPRRASSCRSCRLALSAFVKSFAAGRVGTASLSQAPRS